VRALIQAHPLVTSVSSQGIMRERCGRADLHMHTTYSDGTGAVEDVLAHVQHATPLDVIAITDHDTIEGALRARELAGKRRYRFEVIVGEEISTREGHLLALFLERRVPPGLCIERSIELVHAQGGLAIVAHPFNRVFRHSVQRPVMDRILRQPEVHPDGIETLNGSFAGIGSSPIAMRLARDTYHWPEIGGSDAHTPTAIGCAHTLFVGRGAAGLRHALRRGETAPQGGYWLPREYLVLASQRAAYGHAGMYAAEVYAEEERGAVRAARLRAATLGWGARAARRYASRRVAPIHLAHAG
jgi:predicted metal-dependent phosphoesterase TrpH